MREQFYRHLAQTSPAPLALEITHAEGCWLTDADGKKYLDLIGGISVANTGHRHPKVIEAIKEQLDHYLHIMVYGEFIESPQVRYAKRLSENLPASLDTVYFTNSGAEAVEGAMKLAKRITGRPEFIAFDKAYHGSTQGALSLIGNEYFRNSYRPLLPGIYHKKYNDPSVVDAITEQTAAIIVEPVQAEAGIIKPATGWLQSIRTRCDQTGTLLIFDEIQTGFGRTGSLWAFEETGVVPDILLLGKALGGGLPLGAFISSHDRMMSLSAEPVLGHITTFGGHPLSCQAGLAAFNLLLEEKLWVAAREKESIFRSLLHHPKIKNLRSAGLWMAIEFSTFEENKKIIDDCISHGLLTDWFLFADQSLRISPPLTINKEEITLACHILLEAMNA